MPDPFTIDLDNSQQTAGHHYAAAHPRDALLVLAHGAGAGQRHPWIVAMASGFAARGVDVVTFDFPYMHGRRRVPDRAPVLEDCFRAAIAASVELVPDRRLFIGGKSMGGRIATHLSTGGIPDLAGTIVFGYPLHPPGRPHQPRIAHLPSIATPLFIAQGERDAFGTPEEIRDAFAVVRQPVTPRGAGQVPRQGPRAPRARLDAVTLHVVAGGDHSFTVRGAPPERVRDAVLDAAAAWIG